MPADFKLEEQEKRDCGFKYTWAEELRIRWFFKKILL
jgi:hypothetical protein